MSKKKAYDPKVYVDFIDERLREDMETSEQILWNFSAALHSIGDEEERFLRGEFGSNEKPKKASKRAAAGGK